MLKVAWMRILPAAGLALVMSGCISYKSATETTDTAISDAAFIKQITLGETKTDWLVEQFGYPTAVRKPSPDSAVWQYENVVRSTTELRALPIFAFESQDSSRTIYNFEIENDCVVRYWKDAAEPH